MTVRSKIRAVIFCSHALACGDKSLSPAIDLSAGIADSGHEHADPDAGFYVFDAKPPTTDAGHQKFDLVLVDLVFDGDTVRLNAGPDAPKTPDGKQLNREIVRLLGVDAPEIEHPPDPTPAECWGNEAKEAARVLMFGKKVRIEYDPAHDFRENTPSKRLLAYVILVDQDIMANAELIKTGNACSFRAFRHEKLSEYNALEGTAETAGLGIWAGCANPCD